MSSRDAGRIHSGAVVGGEATRPAEPSITSLLKADFAAWAQARGKRFPSFGAVIDALLMPGMLATINFRLSHSLHVHGVRPLSRLLYIWNMILFSVDMAPGAVIGPGFLMPHPVGVGVGKWVRIGRNAKVMGGVRLGGGNSEDPESDGMPQFGDDCWLLDGSKAFGNLVIGDSCVIAASAVLLESIPARSVAAGIPARVVRTRELK